MLDTKMDTDLHPRLDDTAAVLMQTRHNNMIWNHEVERAASAHAGTPSLTVGVFRVELTISI
jgi:hypothetical protein